VARGAVADNGVVESDVVEWAVVVVFEAGGFEVFDGSGFPEVGQFEN
jgi:hypothetical protein